MPRYFFHTVGDVREPDRVGTDLPNDTTARLMATRYAGEMLRDLPEQLWQDGRWRVEVTDEQGLLCWTVLAIAVDAKRSAD